MATEIPWPVERHSYLPDPSLPLAHAFTRARIFCEGSGHQTSHGVDTGTGCWFGLLAQLDWLSFFARFCLDMLFILVLLGYAHIC